MTDVAEFLTEWGIDASEADVVAVLDTTFRAMPIAYAAVPSQSALEYLAEHGGPEAAEEVAKWSPEEEIRRRNLAVFASAGRLVAGTMSVDQVAEEVGLTRSRVQHYITDSRPRLYSVKVGSRRRIPSWQIHGGKLLPGLDRLVPVIPADVHPLDVAALMTTPQDELAGRTAVEHLAEGGDVEPVAALLADLDRW